MHASKLHATGNDFLVVDARTDPRAASLGAPEAEALCDRNRGIGADGLILLLAPTDASCDARMVLLNADGHPAEMSGNGIRCLAFVAAQLGVGTPERIVFETAAGTRVVDHERDASGAVVGGTVDMGPVTFEPAAIPVAGPSSSDLTLTVGATTYSGDAAGMGNPHWVFFVDDVDAVPLRDHGAIAEHDARFPRRTNVEFAQVVGLDALRMIVWERGVGETLSCGTGACATAAVAHRRGLVGPEISVTVPGGVLRVQLGDTVRLGGPVTPVFEVDVDVDALVAARARDGGGVSA